MAVVIRGWSRTASTALKLATAERVIGYQFKDVDLLYEALDQKRYWLTLPSGRKRERARNTRLALVGDAQAKLYTAKQWYDKQNLNGTDWSTIATTTLSNNHLGELGFRLGLDECTISKNVEKTYDMATTVEAVFAAVEMDGAGQEQLHKIMARFGVQHELLDPIQRAWIYKAVKSKLSLPDRFFIGHHFKLQQGIFDTQLLRHSIAQEEPGRVEKSWTSIKHLCRSMRRIWLRPRKTPSEPRKGSVRLRGQKGPVLGSAKPSPGIVKPLAERPRPTGTGRVTTPSRDVATSKTDVPGEGSPGRSEDDERAAAPEQTTGREDPVKKHKAAELSSPEVPTPSQPREPEARKADTLADVVRTARHGSQDSKKASGDEPTTNPSRKDDAATGAKLKVEHQPGKASGPEPLEATEAGDSQDDLEKTISRLKEKDERLLAKYREMVQAFAELRLAGKKKTAKQGEEYEKLVRRRKRIKELLRDLTTRRLEQQTVAAQRGEEGERS